MPKEIDNLSNVDLPYKIYTSDSSAACELILEEKVKYLLADITISIG